MHCRFLAKEFDFDLFKLETDALYRAFEEVVFFLERFDLLFEFPVFLLKIRDAFPGSFMEHFQIPEVFEPLFDFRFSQMHLDSISRSVARGVESYS